MKRASSSSPSASDSEASSVNDPDLEATLPPPKRIRVSSESSPFPSVQLNYVKELNEIIRAASALPTDIGYDRQDDDEFHHSFGYGPIMQVGAVSWSQRERQSLSNAIVRHGRHNIARLADAVPEKSIPEIRALIDLLETALAQLRSFASPHKILLLADIPTAFEIGDDCLATLDEVALQLHPKYGNWDAHIEWLRYGENWLLESKKAEFLDCLSYQGSVRDKCSFFDIAIPQNTNEPEIEFEAKTRGIRMLKPETSGERRLHERGKELLRDIPEAHLLHVSMFLELSSNIFMKEALRDPQTYDARFFDPLTGNHVSGNFKEPSIFRSALVDLHSLVINLTRRLVQATLFMASSQVRLHVSDEQGTKENEDPNDQDASSPNEVTEEAARAAISCLGMEPRNDYWPTCAQRNGLHIGCDIKKNASLPSGPKKVAEDTPLGAYGLLLSPACAETVLWYDQFKADTWHSYKKASVKPRQLNEEFLREIGFAHELPPWKTTSRGDNTSDVEMATALSDGGESNGDDQDAVVESGPETITETGSEIVTEDGTSDASDVEADTQINGTDLNDNDNQNGNVMAIDDSESENEYESDEDEDLSLEREEDEHVEHLDMQKNRIEERRLLALLRPEDTSNGAAAQAEPGQAPEHGRNGDSDAVSTLSRRKRRKRYVYDNWLARMQYVAPWEIMEPDAEQTNPEEEAA